MNDKSESLRQLAEMALNAGRKRQSPQSGYLHHCYAPQSDEPHLTIPIIENLLFTLALFKSRTAENVTEAKAMLESLLHFQNRDGANMAAGNFPIYLHEYPICKERYTSVHAGVPLFWILKLFHQVLGRDLKQRLEEALTRILQHIERNAWGENAPYHVAVKAACLAHAGGTLLGLSVLADEGMRQLEHLHKLDERAVWYCPAASGTMLSGLAMVYPNMRESPWVDLWNFLESTWHRSTCSYIGPPCKERQYGFDPQVTLYDLFLGLFSGEFSSRALQDSITHLEAALIPFCSGQFQSLKYPLRMEGTCKEKKWEVFHGEKLAYCTLEKSSIADHLGDKGFHTLKVVWGDSAKMHSMVCQGGNSGTVRLYPVHEGLDIFFHLAGPLEAEDRDKNREIMFFVDMHAGLDVEISDHKATTFSLGEKITLRSGDFDFSLQFQLEEGSGRFMGHRMLGNRPAQLKLKGKDRFSAYDWQLFLRTMQRSDQCIVKASLRGLKI